VIDASQRRRGFLVAGCMFMEIFDGTVVSTAAPRIGAALRVPVSAVGLVITAYLITAAMLIPLSGWAVARFGTRRVFLARSSPSPWRRCCTRQAAGSANSSPGGSLLIAGGFGVGKTTLVGAVSEIKPLRTEERLSEIGASVDDLTGVAGKTTTTVALDFGRITISPQIVLYLFGTPGQDRYWLMRKELSVGALGAVVLVDTRRLGDSFGALDFFESRNVPFIVAVNCFDDADIYEEDELRQALDIGDHVPVQLCDARNRASGKQVLIRLLEHLMATAAGKTHARQW
jgi:hypothetical protein